MEPYFRQITFVIFFAVSSLSISDLEQDSENIDANVNVTAALLSPLSLPETFLRRGALPPSHVSYDSQREYRLEDFLWTGSGQGPMPAEKDGGLAWEDNHDAEGQVDVIVRVTETLVLYTTVLTTTYPVELTPTVLISTPVLLDRSSSFLMYSSSISSHFLETSFSFNPSASLSASGIQPIVPTPTVTASVPPSVTPPEEMPTPASEGQPDVTASTNRLYWVNTVIKANGSKVKTESQDFQVPMQKNLARVYASAFKRHLLSSLGLMKKDGGHDHLRRRRRRSSDTGIRRRANHEREDLDFEWMFVKEGMTTSQIQSLATTMMNVSVSIVNITSDPKLPIVSMNYIVSAEGSPIPGSSAVQDLDLVTKSEMEQEIGYEVIMKAEAFVNQPAREMSLTEKAETSPWLIVAIAAICAFIFSLIGLTYLAWKSKRTAISDNSPEPARHQQGIEGGSINQAFLGSPIRVQSGRSEEVQVLSETKTLAHTRKNSKHKKKSSLHELSSGIRPDSRQSEQRKHLASELSSILGKNGEREREIQKILPSEVKRGTKSSSSSPNKSSDSAASQNSASVPRRPRSRRAGSSEIEPESLRKTEIQGSAADLGTKNSAGRRRRRKTGIGDEFSLQTNGSEDNVSLKSRSRPGFQMERTQSRSESVREQRPLSASRDKITLGHLDMSDDPIAQSMSEKAKKAIKGHGNSHSGKMEESQKEKRKSQSASSLQLPETIDEVSDLQSTDGGVEVQNLESLEQQDREMDESLEEIGPSSKTATDSPSNNKSKKDAQVQTPTRSRVRVKTKVKPKSKGSSSRPQKLFSESSFTTESEEIIETTHFEETSAESNPLGKMRKRFHKFLDDAFNVMGKTEDEEGAEVGRSKSAKVSISHEIAKRETERPWTTHVINEESVKRLRPKSASFGPIPRPAWTDSSERRCHSAKSEASTQSSHAIGRDRGMGQTIKERDENPEESDLSSTTVPTTASEIDRGQGQTQTISRPTAIPIFPHYPIYPDIPILPAQQGPSHMTDPAVPLIRAIKEEIKRFEKVKVKGSADD